MLSDTTAPTESFTGDEDLSLQQRDMRDFVPPSAPSALTGLFASAYREIVQSAEQSHEYKKTSGSSDSAHTYDTTAR